MEGSKMTHPDSTLDKLFRHLGLLAIFLFGFISVLGSGGGGGGDSTTPPPSDTTPPITTANPTGGLYNSSQQVTLTSNEAATIYYSTDGNDPSVGGGNTTSGNSPIANIPIPAGTTILKFFAIDQANNSETVKTETYIIDVAAPTIIFPGGAPSPIGLLGQATVTWQSDEDGDYIIELGGNGLPGSGTQIAAGTVQANNPVNQSIDGGQLSYTSDTDLWVYVTDAAGNDGSNYESLSLKPFVQFPGISASKLLINNSGTRLYALSGSVKVIDIDPGSGDYNTLIATITVGNTPATMAITPDNARLYVTNHQSDSISVITTSSNTVSETLTPTISAPYGIAITPDGTRAYITDYDGFVRVLNIDPTSPSYHSIITTIIMNPLFYFGEIAITPNGSIAIVNWQGMISTGVDVIDITFNIPIAYPVPVINGSGNEVITSSDSQYAYVIVYGGSNALKKIDLSDYSIPFESTYAEGISLTPDNQILLAGTTTLSGDINLIDADDLTILGRVPVGGLITRSIVTPDGNNAYVNRFNSSTSTDELLMLPLH
jgi:YVTN family beta-propeller protein